MEIILAKNFYTEAQQIRIKRVDFFDSLWVLYIAHYLFNTGRLLKRSITQ